MTKTNKYKSKTPEERKVEMQRITETLENGVKAVFESDNYKNYLRICSQYHYSFNNLILILSQCPNATIVKSYADWKKDGYAVKRNEKGIKILVPIKYHYEKEEVKENSNGQEQKETVEVEGIHFKIGNVFNVTQTTLENTPSLVSELTDNSEEVKIAVDELVSSDTAIDYDPDLNGKATNGYFRPDNGIIRLKPSMSSSQTLKTLIHEKAHSLLHASGNYERNTAEIEAESCAFVVSSALALDTSSYSFGYIAGYSKNKELKELKSSLDRILKTSKKILDWVTSTTDLQIVWETEA